MYLLQRGRFSLWAWILVILWGSGCSLNPGVRIGKDAVTAPKDAGTPARIDRDDIDTRLTIPPQTRVSIVKTAAIPGTVDTPGRPAVETLTFDFSQAAEFVQKANKIAATSGTVDTSVAKRRLEVESKEPLLYAAILAGAAAVVFMVLKWPGVSLLCGIGSGAFFVAWKVADVPWWVGVCAIVAGGGLWLGYHRGETDTKKPPLAGGG